MSEMVERVARGIYEAMTDSEFIGAGAGPQHDLAFELAAAAIRAMREPTEEMLEAAGAGTRDYFGGETAALYIEMIDAALNSTPKERP